MTRPKKNSSISISITNKQQKQDDLFFLFHFFNEQKNNKNMDLIYIVSTRFSN